MPSENRSSEALPDNDRRSQLAEHAELHLLRIMLRFCKWLIALMLLAAIGVVALNAFDQPLLPEAQHLLAAKPDVPDEQNGFFAMLGFDSAEADFIAAGQRRAKTLLDAQRQGVPVFRYPDFRDEPRLAAFSAEQLPAAFEDVLALARSEPRRVGERLKSSEALLDRYARLKQYPRFAVVAPVGYTGFWIVGPSDARSVWRLQLAQWVAAGSAGKATAALGEDVLFWRRMLAERNVQLLGKMFATAVVRSDFDIARELVRIGGLTAPDRLQLQTLTQPLSATERSLAGVLEDEFRSIAAFYGELPDEEIANSLTELPSEEGEPQTLLRRTYRSITAYFFLRRSTLNEFYRQTVKQIEFDSLPCSQHLPRDDIGAPSPWTLAYNPVGKLLAAISVPSMDYSGRMCDLVGFQRLLALQLRIANEAMLDIEIPRALETAGGELSDPFSGKPMRWLPESRALSFEAADKADQRFLPWHIGANAVGSANPLPLNTTK